MKSEYYKFSSHPIYDERYDIINQNSLNQKTYYNYNLDIKFQYIKAKLFGYTSDEFLSSACNRISEFCSELL